MGNKIMQETTPLVECSAFHRGMSVNATLILDHSDTEKVYH